MVEPFRTLTLYAQHDCGRSFNHTGLLLALSS